MTGANDLAELMQQERNLIMQKEWLQRNWLSPLTGLAFGVVSVTGLALLFDLHIGPLKVLHEWMGVLLAFAGILHVAVNWRVFTTYFKHRIAYVMLVIGVVLSIGLMLAGNHEGPEGPGGHHGPPPHVMD